MGEPSPCASWLDVGFREATSRDASSGEATLRPVGLSEARLHEALKGQMEKLPSEGCSTSDSRTPSEVPEVNPEFENAEIDSEGSVPTHCAGMSQQQALDGQDGDPVSDAANEVLTKTMPDSLGAVNILESLPLTPLAPEAHVEPSEVPEVNLEFQNAEIDFEEPVPTHHAGASQQQALAGQESDPVSDTADEVLATTMPDSPGTIKISESVPLTPLATQARAKRTEVADEAPMPCSTATESQRAVPYMAGEDLPAKGFVSQRVKAFVSLSSGKVMSISAMGREAMPDRGMVSERIQAHQRFISKATTSAM
jgi:hypothetical protein